MQNKKSQLDNIYNETFYNNQIEGSLNSANRLLSILYKIYAPESVLDVGCGRGAWLVTCEKFGSSKLTGLDGPWISPDKLLSPNIQFYESDFEHEIAVSGKFDLALSLEVAEHIEEKHARQFVSALCKASDLVYFWGCRP